MAETKALELLRRMVADNDRGYERHGISEALWAEARRLIQDVDAKTGAKLLPAFYSLADHALDDRCDELSLELERIRAQLKDALPGWSWDV